MAYDDDYDDYDDEYDDEEGIYDDFYDEEEDDNYDEYDDEGDDFEEDDEETFEPDDEFGGDGDIEVDDYEPPPIPELLTDISGYVGTVAIMETGVAKVNVELDFKDIYGIYTYEVRVTPL